ncbi:uncharacterized protein LOC121371626 [Gigantopelta aegis]|uniref:uncharacterized protein LOC121371626 n=1 Tax=Gigantopelta aegis TaxID=1735272 RepID=UPI001B88B8AD|nr:uncharacterized protein LOC121371626 [Gigantopelta aegis]
MAGFSNASTFIKIDEKTLDTGTIRRLVIFCLWTLTSFLCHQTAKAFLRNGSTYLQDQGIFLAFILTLTQGLACFSLVDIHQQKDKLFYVMTLSHLAATFATNCSMAFMTASSTFAIKLMEPITSAVVQRLVLATSLSRSTLISLPLIVSGAVVFAGNPLATSSLSMGVLMALASNIILAVRNVAMKLRQNNSKNITLRSTVHIWCVVSGGVAIITAVYILEAREILPHRATLIIGMMFMSSFFHVVYSYVSTNIVLRYMSVVSHAVSNIFKRVIVVLLLYMVGQRHATRWNFAGLVVCTLGLRLYIRGKNKRNEKSLTDSSKQMTLSYKKTLLVILAMFIIGVVGNAVYTGVICTESLSAKMFIYNPDEFESKAFKDGSFENNSLKLMNESQIKHFFQWRLLDHKLKTNLLAPLLPTNIEIIREAQRVHFNLFREVIGKFKYAMLLDVAAFENKGDPAITAGEVLLLRRLGIQVIFYCSCLQCENTKLQDYAEKMSKRYSNKELVILFHGGGNLVGYSLNDNLRGRLFPRFKGFKMVIFSQSVFVRKHLYEGSHFDYCQKLYCCNPNLTIVLRDKQSFGIALKYWNNGTNFILAPDMAFQIGAVNRFMYPSYDIMWLKRKDEEAPKYLCKTLMFPNNVTVRVSDWLGWKTTEGSTTMETAFLQANNGLVFLQRGRVVITDRLHGHILSTLLNIPHVLIDNQYKKLSSYHNTWTRSLHNVLITNDSSKAFPLALTLLERFKNELPSIAPIMEVREFSNSRSKKPAKWFLGVSLWVSCCFNCLFIYLLY